MLANISAYSTTPFNWPEREELAHVNPVTKGVMSSDQARRGYKAAIDAALGRSSQALTEWIEGFR